MTSVHIIYDLNDQYYYMWDILLSTRYASAAVHLNDHCLFQYIVFLGIIIIGELTAGVLAIIFKENVCIVL